MSISSLSNHTANVQRKTRTLDATGGVSSAVSFTNVYTSVVGNMQTKKSSDRRDEVDGKPTQFGTHTYYSETLLTLQNGDRFVFNSENYEYLSTEDMGGRGRGYAYHLRRIKG